MDVQLMTTSESPHNCFASFFYQGEISLRAMAQEVGKNSYSLMIRSLLMNGLFDLSTYVY